MVPSAWVVPTFRAIRWHPLAGAAAGVATVAVGCAFLGAPVLPAAPVAIAASLIVAAATMGLEDPAHALIDAVPAGFGRRLAHRLAWLLPATGVALVLSGWLADDLGVAGISWRMLASAAALTAVAVATFVLVARRRPDLAVSVGAAVPVLWATSSVVAPSAVGPVADLWLDHAWMVIGIGVAVSIVGVRRH